MNKAWIEDAAEVVAESALYSARENGSPPDREYRDASMHADDIRVVRDIIKADMRLSPRLGNHREVSDHLLHEVRWLAVKTLDAGSTDPREIKPAPAPTPVLSAPRKIKPPPAPVPVLSALRDAADPDLRAWMDAHADTVSAACLEAAPKLTPPKPYRYSGVGDPAGEISDIQRGRDSRISVWVNDAAHPSWLMQAGTDPARYLLQPWGILLSREDVAALPGIWRDAETVVGNVKGNLIILLDIGDGHGPLPRFAKSDGRCAAIIKIGRRSWRVAPSEEQPNYLGKLGAGGNVILFENDRLHWTAYEVTPPRRPASAPPKRLSEDEKRKVDQIVLSTINGSFPRSVKSIAEGNVEKAWWDDTTSPNARWIALMTDIDNDASYSSAAAETMVRASLARSEKMGKAMKAEDGWLRT